jgi:hypothetical protein
MNKYQTELCIWSATHIPCGWRRLFLQSAVNHPTKSFISHIKEPQECWTVLQNHFARNTIARKFYLYRRLLTSKMKEGEKFDSFFDRFTQLKCDLEDMGKLFEEEDLVFIILHALPRSWHEFTRRCDDGEFQGAHFI